MAPKANLQRLLTPRHVAVVGGESAAQVIRQSRRAGFTGSIWPVNPKRNEIEGIPCFRGVADLPEAPDASFVAIPRAATVRTVAELADRGAGGAVLHASGFAEHDAEGVRLERALVEAAGEMALLGPNCIGMLNYLDGVALWPDEHGGSAVDRGVAILTQSGNIGQNLTMQRRGLPVAHLLTHGNAANTDIVELAEHMLDDPRVTAIGLHLEGIDDVSRLAKMALRALCARVPVVVLKTGTSELGAQVNASHTSSLASSDVLCDVLFKRLGAARVSGLDTFVETLKFLHVHGALPGRRIASASCSGGEAALVADLANERALSLPSFDEQTESRLRWQLGDRVTVSNPLDYHTYIWGDFEAQRDCFVEYLGADVDCHLLCVDFPRADRCVDDPWETTVRAFLAARQKVVAGGPEVSAESAPAVVSLLPEGMPEASAQRLLDESIAPMQGLDACIQAIDAAAFIGQAQRGADQVEPPMTVGSVHGPVRQLDEYTAKQELSGYGITVPEGVVETAQRAAQAADGMGFPVAVKAVSAELAHKTEVGGVRTGLRDAEQVDAAAHDISALDSPLLIERMVDDAEIEMVVGLQRDSRFGVALTIGAGGILVELLRDSVTLLWPATADDIRDALRRLRIWPLMAGFRGRSVDVDALVGAVTAIGNYVERNPDVLEVDVNPLLVRSPGMGAVAVDALVRYADPNGEGTEVT